jgi:hypothetical protein
MVARAAISTLFALVACNNILAIEDAHVDPTLGAGGGGAGTSGSGSKEGGASGTTGGAGNGGETSNAGKSSGGNAGQSTGGSAAQGGNTIMTQGGAEGGSAAGAGGEAGSGAGPGMGSLCQQYCDTVAQYCIGTSLQYKDREQCMKVCGLFPQGAVGDPDGNHIACRLKYAGKARYAGGTELAAYCRQAGPGGDGRCGTNCDGFCTITMDTCNAEDTPPYFFQNDAACHAKCQSLPDIPFVYGDISVADGNSVQCRLFHVISAAMMDPEEHCEHVMGLTLCEE